MKSQLVLSSFCKEGQLGSGHSKLSSLKSSSDPSLPLTMLTDPLYCASFEKKPVLLKGNSAVLRMNRPICFQISVDAPSRALILTRPLLYMKDNFKGWQKTRKVLNHSLICNIKERQTLVIKN